jgi:replicative DNA helicase
MAVGGIRTTAEGGCATRAWKQQRSWGVQPAGAYGGEAKSYFTGEDKIIIAKQRSGPAGTYIKVRFDGPRGRWEGR